MGKPQSWEGWQKFRIPVAGFGAALVTLLAWIFNAASDYPTGAPFGNEQASNL